MSQPEKLNLWDRFFNRKRKVIVEEGQESWSNYPLGTECPSVKVSYYRHFVKYKVIDRLTGSETLEKEYLN